MSAGFYRGRLRHCRHWRGPAPMLALRRQVLIDRLSSMAFPKRMCQLLHGDQRTGLTAQNDHFWPFAPTFELPLSRRSCRLRAMTMFVLWNFAALGAALFCIARGVIDLRQRKYAWGILGVGSATIFMLTPIQTHAVKINVPTSSSR